MYRPNSENSIERLRMRESVDEFSVPDENLDIVKNVKKCETKGCDGKGSTRPKKSGNGTYKTHRSSIFCPNRDENSREDSVSLISAQNQSFLNTSQNENEQIQNNFLKSEEAYKIFANDNNLAKEQSSKIKSLENTVLELGKLRLESEER